MESVQFEAETRAVSIGKPCRSLRKRHAAVSGISVPSERNLHISFVLSPHPHYNCYYKPNYAEYVDRHATREGIKQSVPVVDGADGVDEGVVEGAGDDAFRDLVDGCHGK